MRLRKAVIPAAGRGTRMQPFSNLLAKELVPLGATPALEFVLLEAIQAELTDIGLIVREAKQSLRKFVESLSADSRFRQLSVTFIDQPEPTGLADALVTADEFVDGEPFAVLLPDNVLLGKGDSLLRLRRAFEVTGLDTLGVIEVPSERSGEFGNCGLFDAAERSNGLLEIERLTPRGEGRLIVAPGTVRRRTCGRFIAKPHLFDSLRESRAANPQTELDEQPALRAILEQQGLTGCLLPDPLFDVGHPNGVLAASAHLYAQREETTT